MTKPPKTTPHSDLNGVHEDERRHIDAANEAGQDSADLKKAKEESIGRPPYTDNRESKDDASE